MYKLMIIEDDTGIAEGIDAQAKSWNFETHIVKDFKNVISEFGEFDPHIVLLDITLPFYNGFHWCNEIRRISKVPIIFISSANDNMNIVMAMNMGADDFIAKPFDGSVLMAKVQAMLRRSYDFATSAPLMEHREAILDTGDQSLNYHNEKIDLTKNEYRILYCLMQNKGKVVSREKLMESLWESDAFVDDNTLTVNINRLRKKLEKADLTDYISTKIGVGYIIE